MVYLIINNYTSSSKHTYPHGDNVRKKAVFMHIYPNRLRNDLRLVDKTMIIPIIC